MLEPLFDKLPFFVLISLFLAYIIWAKFRNENKKLKIETIDNLLDILGILIVILISTSLFFLAFSLPTLIIDHSSSFEVVFSGLKFFIAFMGLFLIFYFIVLFRKTEKEKHFEWIISILLFVQLWSIALFLGCVNAICITSYKKI